MTINRRGFLAAAGLSALSGSMGGADLTKMIVHSSRPSDLEMGLDGFAEWITPADRFFVRCHTYVPSRVDLTAWKLRLDGVVNQPLSLTMDDLKKLPRVEQVSVLECAGNGRSFYQPHVAGTQWAFGSVGNGRWTGVRFRDVLAKAGLKNISAPRSSGWQRRRRSEPCQNSSARSRWKRRMDPDTLLAYEMNGEELPQDHGFPLRVIAPGWASDSWVKWLSHVEVLDHEFEGFWMKTAYRHPTHAGHAGRRDRSGHHGSGHRPQHEVRDRHSDGGFAQSRQGADQRRGVVEQFAGCARRCFSEWRRNLEAGQARSRTTVATPGGLWQYDWTAADGTHTLMARATNAAGTNATARSSLESFRLFVERRATRRGRGHRQADDLHLRK